MTLTIVSMLYHRKVPISKTRCLSCSVGKSPTGAPEACFLRISLMVPEDIPPLGGCAKTPPPPEHDTHQLPARVPVPQHDTVKSELD